MSIESFGEVVRVILSKQRPRRIAIRGSDGVDHTSLLKGNEDLSRVGDGVKTHELSRCPQPICVVCGVVVACRSLHSFGARCCCRVSPFALGLAGISTFACRLSWLPNGAGGQIAAVLEAMLAFFAMFFCEMVAGLNYLF